MPQTTVLVAGQSAANSTDIVVSPLTLATVGLFSASTIPSAFSFTVFQKTPSAAVKIATLSAEVPSLSISSPGTFYVARPDITSAGVNVGVFTET
jgi:hypothetical protein